jgi:hypothetical protein
VRAERRERHQIAAEANELTPQLSTAVNEGGVVWVYRKCIPHSQQRTLQPRV